MNGPQTLSNSCRSDESALHHHGGSLLSCDTSYRGALQWLVELPQKLRISRTEVRSVCVSMMTGCCGVNWVQGSFRGCLEPQGHFACMGPHVIKITVSHHFRPQAPSNFSFANPQNIFCIHYVNANPSDCF
jgi:hypothetical protein